jgi:hypothetical protein
MFAESIKHFLYNWPMKHLLLFLIVLSTTYVVRAQMPETIKKGDITLVFKSNDASFSAETKKRLIDAFWIVYPKEMAEYNNKSAKLVTFFIDTAYTGVAATGNDVVRYNPKWFISHPEDIDVVTHEVMHIVQNYGRGVRGTGWLTEGIADYVRNEFGVNNEKSGWKLTEYKAGQNYDNSYRITARFLLWNVNHKNRDLVLKLDAAMRDHTYTPELWVQLTGKSVEELWSEYAANPTI